MQELVCAVDVGTTSARAGLFDKSGAMLARQSASIDTARPQASFAEHNSEQIWMAVCNAVRAVVLEADFEPSHIKAIGFDATCSLVMRASDGSPVQLSGRDGEVWDTLAWFDHRALSEANTCTASADPILSYHGGTMSPEMQVPKLMWLKQNRPDIWNQAKYLFDLADFLTWRASGSVIRSLNTLSTKWSYQSDSIGWPRDFFRKIDIVECLNGPGLDEPPVPIGSAVGQLTQKAAIELGLSEGCLVAAGLVDAYAGTLGSIGWRQGGAPNEQASLIAGTSNCIMCVSEEKRLCDGVWGPYFGSIFDGVWVSEAGQSAAGSALDFVLRMYDENGQDPLDESAHSEILARIDEMRQSDPHRFGQDVKVLPDFHGRRSPHPDPLARGVISGLPLDRSEEALCKVYWRTALGISLGIRQIVDTLTDNGFAIRSLGMAGGHSRSPSLIQLYADVTGLTIHTDGQVDHTLLGSAMAAATATGWYSDLLTAHRSMLQSAKEYKPDLAAKEIYDRDFSVFKLMKQHREEILNLSKD